MPPHRAARRGAAATAGRRGGCDIVPGMSATLHRHTAGLTWTESGAMARSAHALVSQGGVWLIDPFDDLSALTAAAELGEPAGVIQLLDRHNRDCEAIAAAARGRGRAAA